MAIIETNSHRSLDNLHLDPNQAMEAAIEKMEGLGGDLEIANCYRQQWQQYNTDNAMKPFSLSPQGTHEFYDSMDRARAAMLAIRRRCEAKER